MLYKGLTLLNLVVVNRNRIEDVVKITFFSYLADGTSHVLIVPSIEDETNHLASDFQH